jgi:hypothetical protein
LFLFLIRCLTFSSILGLLVMSSNFTGQNIIFMSQDTSSEQVFFGFPKSFYIRVKIVMDVLTIVLVHTSAY